jgi:hypothetical protein
MKDIATLIKDNFQSYLQLEDSIGVTGVVEEISNDYLELNHFEDNTAKQYYTSYNGDEVVNGLAENNKFLKSDVINMLSTNGYEPVDTRIREIIVNDSFKEIRDMCVITEIVINKKQKRECLLWRLQRVKKLIFC